MRNISYLKVGLGIGLMVLIQVVGSCCVADIHYWKEIKLLLMGIAAVLFVMGTTDFLTENK